MLRLAFDFIITWRETRTRPNAYLCLWDFEDKFKKGDNLILTAFGAGFAWGAIYIKWGYDGKNR